MKLVTVVGARPQFIKASVLSRLIAGTPGITELLVHTGQHYDPEMSEIFFQELEIPAPFAHLGVGSGPHGAQTGRMLEAVEAILCQESPDAVLVYGDTNSTLAGALAAAKLHIPVAHVEAGLRSFNRDMPEEVNRVLTDHVATWLFAPTWNAADLLAREGLPEDAIHLVGDIMYDAALAFGARARARSRILEACGLPSKGYVLATVHRAENTDDPGRLAIILEALGVIAHAVPVVLPLHRRTAMLLDTRYRHIQVPPGILRIPPVGYLDMACLEENALAVATDSGGVQKESFFHRVPCVTLRHETEWTELVEMGWNHLSPPVAVGSIVTDLRAAMEGPPGRPGTPYGDGQCAKRILATLLGGPADWENG